MNTPSPDIRTLHSLLFSRLARYLLAALLGASAVAAHGQVSGTSSVIATDNAGNYSSFGGSAESSSPANGGSGFGAWNFTGNSTTNTSYCGEFLGAAPNTGLIGSGNSWGLYSNTSNTASIYRGFGFDIIGDTISVDLENTSTINGTIGWSLWNASQTNMTEFFFASGNTNWTVPDAAGSASSVSYTTSAIQTDITITSATTFSLTATINGGSSSMTTGSFENGTTATGISDLFRFFSFNDGNSNNLYINNEQVFVSTYSGASGNYGTAGNWSSNGQLSATPINGANIAFGGSVAATATNNLVTTVNSYTFNGAAGSYTLSGSAVTLGDAGSDNSGITNNSSNLQTVAENLTLGSGATGATVGATVTSASGATTLAGTVNLNGSRLLVTGTGNTTISGLVSGASDILKQGTGTLLLNNAANTFGVNTSGTGNVYIDAGTVSVGATGALGSTDGATYGAVNLGSSVSTQSTNNTALLISTGGVTVSNPIDARYFTGNTYGTEQIGGSNTSGVATFSGPIFLHNSLTISSVSGGTVNISGAISQGGTTGAFAGEAVNGTPGITTTGNGVVELTGTSTYSGATTVGGGAMILSGSLTGTSSASVASGASLEVDGGLNNSATTTVSGTLDGTGSVGAITANGGAIAAGLTVANSLISTGTLTAAGGVTLSGSTTFSIRVGIVSGASNDNDQLAVNSGSVSLSGAILQLTLGGHIDNPANLGHTFVIINGGAGTTGTNGNIFAGQAEGSTINAGGGYQFTVDYASSAGGGALGSGNDVVLQLGAVPEPGTWASLAVGLVLLTALSRRRRPV